MIKSAWLTRFGIGLAVILAAVLPSPAQDTGSLQQLVQANNRFAIDIFQKISPNATENVFLSPYSISSALAMTWAGAKGETAGQMAKALHFSELPAGDVTHDFNALNKALADAQSASGAQLSVANSLWPDQDPEHPFLPEYIASVEKDFAAGLFPVDYQHHAEESRLKINQWVEDKTQDKIKDLLHQGDVTGATRLVLVNAIYFKGQWENPFEERMTKDEPFYAADGTSKSVKLMNHTFQAIEARYADITSGPVPFQMLSLNYLSKGFARPGGTGLSMLVVLPRTAGDLGALEKAVTAEQLAAWVGEMEPTKVHVFLPKFKLEGRYDKMPDQLMELGSVDAFNARANFAGMDGARDLHISKVIHQTFVAVDEKGTEAAAATAVGMFGGGMPRAEAPPPVFRADHPFLFFIRENATGSILFMGRLVNPSASSLTSSQTATPPGGGVPRGATTADVMLNSLRLDDATRAKVKPILDDELKKMLDLQADKTLSSDERAARNNSIKADTDAQLKLVLTDDQYAQWQKLLQPRVSNHPVPVDFNSMRDGNISQPSQSQQNAPPATPPAAPTQN